MDFIPYTNSSRGKKPRTRGLVIQVPVKRCFAYLDNQSTYGHGKHPTCGLKNRAMHNVQTPPPQPASFKDTSTGSPVRVTSQPKSPPFKNRSRAYLFKVPPRRPPLDRFPYPHTQTSFPELNDSSNILVTFLPLHRLHNPLLISPPPNTQRINTHTYNRCLVKMTRKALG